MKKCTEECYSDSYEPRDVDMRCVNGLMLFKHNNSGEIKYSGEGICHNCKGTGYVEEATDE